MSPTPAPVTASSKPAGLVAAAPQSATATTHAPAPIAEIPAPPADAYYKNCAAARSAGAAPLYAADPGYRKGLDRDGDGVACE
ncbi:excalibur calcium-binding domain-containing protein [Tessaracoccus sp. MC1756]|uniref:excalibur calcium-binding domain-containing protein n=1 Tax=Tessaracoccus sp. MC1756 TaxID=2760311 RepID=UPI0021051167|nr:excalibur calcium-binding domain-containing protein [Tessaracoccus sp. MC1756]